jgi:carbon-monoxide dehydrogenase large subunit
MVGQKLKNLASHHLGKTVQGGVRPAQLELAEAAVRVSESPELSITLAQCARLCVPDGSSVAAATASGSAILNLPDSLEPGLDETSFFSAKSVVWGNASHAAIVEVDPDLGTFEILRYVVAHDVGRMLNPLLVNGQVHGGVAQGIGGAVLEELVYGQDGQLVSSNMADYMLPRRSDIPKIEVIGIESPSPMNPLGAKGAGEGGTIGPPAALAAAVEDALLPFGVRITRTPLSPAVILGAIRDAKDENG